MEIEASSRMIEMEEGYRGGYLVWEELSVVLPNLVKGAPRRLLSGLTGYARPSRIMAVLGLSGSGKTTLLDSLAGRRSASVIQTGNVLFNGKNTQKDRSGISYVTQEDYFLGTLTVRETITYSAYLRLPKTTSNEEVNALVEMTIMEMGLNECAENRIGNKYMRGLSTGEKKRLSISLEILTRPRVLLLDEPTSGLDSASSFFVIQALQSNGKDGKVVVCSIHQPSSDVFELLDDLFVLSLSGEAVYFGEAKMAAEYFNDVGFPCPRRRNPCDHILQCLSGSIQFSSNPPMDMTTAEINAMLIEKYKRSTCSTVPKRIQEISVSEEPIRNESSNAQKASWWKQLCTLTIRSFINMHRDLGYYWLRIIFCIFLSLSVGSMYFNVGKTNSTTWAIQATDNFIYGFVGFLCMGGLPFFIEEIKVFYRERSNEHYGEAIFVISNLLASLPFLIVISISSSTIMYFMLKSQSGFPHYAYFFINFLSFVAVTESCLMIVATLVPNLLMGVAAGTGVIGIMLMASNIAQPLPLLPKFFWRIPMSYLSFASWASQGLYKNDMIGLEFDPLIPGDPRIKGETALQTMYGIYLNHSKWWDEAVVLLLLFSYRLIFFVALKYKDRVPSFTQRKYDNTHIANSKKKKKAFLISPPAKIATK